MAESNMRDITQKDISSDTRNEVRNIIFQLIKDSLFPDQCKESVLKGDYDWNAVFWEMQHQTVQALPWEQLLKNTISDDVLYNKWYMSCVLNRSRWVQILYEQTELLGLLEKSSIRCVIIKGAAAAMAYPQPLLRAVGDIDFLVSRANYERTAQVLENNGYRLLAEKDSKHHHYEYIKNGVIFELHKRLAIISETDEDLLSLFEEGINNRELKRIESHAFPVLPPKLNGLVLMFHINQHLRSGLGLRHIIDWMMYLEEQGGIQELIPLLKQTNMYRLAITVTLIGQRYLGAQKYIQDTGGYPCDELLEYIFAKGNFGRKGAEEGKITSVVLVSGNPLRFFRRLQAGGLHRWHAARKYRILKPFAWAYQFVRITRHLVRNRINPIKLYKLKKIGEEERELIIELGLDIDRMIKTEQK